MNKLRYRVLYDFSSFFVFELFLSGAFRWFFLALLHSDKFWFQLYIFRKKKNWLFSSVRFKMLTYKHPIHHAILFKLTNFEKKTRINNRKLTETCNHQFGSSAIRLILNRGYMTFELHNFRFKMKKKGLCCLDLTLPMLLWPWFLTFSAQ